MLCLASYHGDTLQPKDGLGPVWRVCAVGVSFLSGYHTWRVSLQGGPLPWVMQTGGGVLISS